MGIAFAQCSVKTNIELNSYNREVVIVNRKGILAKLVIVLVIGAFLLPAGNVWAGLVEDGYAHFQDPDFWINGKEPPEPFSMDEVRIDWWVYERDAAGLGGFFDLPQIAPELISDDANYITTFRIINENEGIPNLGLSAIAFHNVYLEPMPTTYTFDGVGVVDDSAAHGMTGYAEPMPDIINEFGGALVTFNFHILLGAGMTTDLGWLATFEGPEAINAVAQVNWLNSYGQTDTVEVASIFGLDPNYSTNIPEPATLLLLGSGLLLAGILRKKILA